MLRMDQAYVIRHKVLVEKISVRRVARELGVSRNTVRRYVEGARPGLRATVERPSPVKERVWPRLEQLLAEAPRWTGGKQRLTAARLHQLGGEPRRQRPRGTGDGRGVEAPAGGGVRPARVQARRPRRGGLLRGARRCRRRAAQGMDVPPAADVLGTGLRLALSPPGSGVLPRRARARLRALRLRPASPGLRQSQVSGGAHPRR